jgi:hypothetical protein
VRNHTTPWKHDSSAQQAIAQQGKYLIVLTQFPNLHLEYLPLLEEMGSLTVLVMQHTKQHSPKDAGGNGMPSIKVLLSKGLTPRNMEGLLFGSPQSIFCLPSIKTSC